MCPRLTDHYKVSSNREIIVGDPIRFINSSSNKPNKKLVMSKFGQSNEIPPRYENIIFDIKSTSDTGLFNKITSMFR